MSVPTAGSAKVQAQGTASRAANSGAMNKAARLGFLAKGLVYALIGLLALQVAFGDNERTDQKGALQTIADKPGGSIVLWLMVIGFAAYALWRLSEAAWGRRDEMDEKKRTAKRIGYRSWRRSAARCWACGSARPSIGRCLAAGRCVCRYWRSVISRKPRANITANQPL